MGDKSSQIRIFLADTGEEVAMAKDAQIHLSPTKEQEQEPSVWSPHGYEITGKAVVTNVGDPIRELLEDMPLKFDVEIRREIGKMPRKMKKAYRIGDRYQRDTKWKRKAKAYARRFNYRLPNAEMVLTREQMGVLEATIKGSSLQYNHDAVAHVSGKDIAKAMSAYLHKR